jgi:hypothetical protein
MAEQGRCQEPAFGAHYWLNENVEQIRGRKCTAVFFYVYFADRESREMELGYDIS